jgi:methionyl-tRNA synthetase
MAKKTNEFKRILVTAALPYANGPIHLGHLAGAYLPADIYVRYQRKQKRDVIYMCASDEHGVPITIAAERQGVSPQDIVDEFHTRNKDAFDKFGISFDYYGRTSSPTHHHTSQDFFLKLNEKGIFKKKTEKQLYDEKTNMFLPDRYVKGTCPICSFEEAYGDQCEKCGSSLSPAELINPKSAISGETPKFRETEHWFLPLGDFQNWVSDWIKTKTDWKPNVLGQVRSWLNDGLVDRAITRDLSWGIDVPLEGAQGKKLYVWFDAPIGYVSATKEWAQQMGKPDLWKTYWQDKETKLVHFIGKDNIVFHCIMFPSILHAYGDFVLPDNVPANEFLNLHGNKLSTSKNYAVWLEDYCKKFPVDPLRYYLAVNAPETKDADFTWQEFQTRNNSELADILGNFINRTLTFANNQFDGAVPVPTELDENDKQLLELLKNAPNTIGAFFETFELRKAVTAYMDVARACNKYFNDQEPWVTAKSNREKCGTTINTCIQACQALAILASPVLPFSAEKLWSILGNNGSVHDINWNDAGNKLLASGHKIGQVEILFPKIEKETIQPEIDRLNKIAQDFQKNEDEPVVEETPRISFEDFKKLDLRVAKVLEAEKVEKTKKLLKLKIKVGAEERQIIAGIAEFYQPEEIIGRKIIIVANLEPATLRGIESNGMLLAAEDDEGNLAPLTVSVDIKTGARVK